MSHSPLPLLLLVLVLLLCSIPQCRAVVLQTRGVGQVPAIDYTLLLHGTSKECTVVIAEGVLQHLYVFVRYDNMGEVQASIQDMFLSVKILNMESSLSSLEYVSEGVSEGVDYTCFQVGGYNYFDENCEYFGEWPDARIFDPDDDPSQVANYYLDFTDMIFGTTAADAADAADATSNSSSTYEVCVGNGWQGSIGPVRYSGNIVFSESELILTALPPSPFPTPVPTLVPSSTPSSCPSHEPTSEPSTSAPSTVPSIHTESPTAFDYIAPSIAPTLSLAPSHEPSSAPSTAFPSSSKPTGDPTTTPSAVPSRMPSSRPTTSPTATRSPTVSPLLLESACDSPLSLAFAANLAPQEEECLMVPMSGAVMSSINISVLFTRQETSFTEAPSDLAILIINTATGEGLQVGGAAIADSRVSQLQSWPTSWNHMHVASGVSSKLFSALVDLSSFQMGGDNVYSICLKNSFFYSEGVRYDGDFTLGGMLSACDIELPVPSAPPTLSPSISTVPTLGKRQVLYQSPIDSGARPVFTFDTLLSGGETMCLETSNLAGAPSAIELELTVTYLNDDPGASWASDLMVSVRSSVNGTFQGDNTHCAHITGDGTNGEIESCFYSGSWPAVMNSGISGLLYSNITIPLSLTNSLATNLASYGLRQVCMTNNFFESSNVQYEGTVAFQGMVSALPPTMVPTTPTVTEIQGTSSSGQLMSPSTFIIAIAIVVFLFATLLGGTYWYRRNKVIYRKNLYSGENDNGGSDSNNDNVLQVDEWSQFDNAARRLEEGNSLEVDLTNPDDQRFFTALRKKRSGLNIHEAKSNNKISTFDKLVKRHRTPEEDGGRSMALAPFPGGATFFDDVMYSGDGHNSTSPTGNDSATVFSDKLPSNESREKKVLVKSPKAFPPVDRSHSNASEDMGMIFDPFYSENDDRSEVSEKNDTRSESLEMFREIGRSSLTLDERPMDSLKHISSTAPSDSMAIVDEKATPDNTGSDLLSAEFLLGVHNFSSSSSEEGEDGNNKEVYDDDTETMKQVGEFHIFSDEENDRPFHL